MSKPKKEVEVYPRCQGYELSAEWGMPLITDVCDGEGCFVVWYIPKKFREKIVKGWNMEYVWKYHICESCVGWADGLFHDDMGKWVAIEPYFNAENGLFELKRFIDGKTGKDQVL